MNHVFHEGHEVAWDGATVWINAPDGCNVARFGRAGVDVHVGMAEQMATGRQCLDCREHGGAPRESWERFLASIREHHGVEIPEMARPDWVR